MENSKIEWTDHTFNPWIGCQHVSPGCDHCYAETQNAFRKWNGGTWGPHAPRKRTSVAYWKNPIKWNAEARTFRREHDHRPRVFCASLADVFDNQVPRSWREYLFALIRECKRLDWLLLTKRPQNISKMLPADWGGGYRNVWLGVTAENQTYFDQRWRILQRIPAVVRFISYEPALGPLRLPKHGPVPDWLISGGESGGGARPLDPQWAHDIIADCRRLGVVPFHKQWGTYHSNPLVAEEGMTVEEAKRIDRFGKGGELVDGKLVHEFPTPCRSDRRDAA
jgi:protein gp37